MSERCDQGGGVVGSTKTDPQPTANTQTGADTPSSPEEAAEKILFQIFGIELHSRKELVFTDLARFIRERDRAVRAEDNPEWDATDAAHPAWWRGDAHGVQVCVDRINRILDGKDDGRGIIGHEPLETLRRRLLALIDNPHKSEERTSDE